VPQAPIRSTEFSPKNEIKLQNEAIRNLCEAMKDNL